jgi:kynurenine/2-aminoadipate aminotransferase
MSASTPTINFAKFFSRRANRLQPSAIRAIQPLLKVPGMISLGGGMPNTLSFPVDTLSVGLKANDNNECNDLNLHIDGAKMCKALQYSSSYGLEGLVEWLGSWQRVQHFDRFALDGRAAMSEQKICIFTGSQHALSVAFDVLVDEGDNVLCEVPTYSGALAALRPIGANLIGVETDAEGIDVDKLESLLDSWDERAERRPKVIYTIPVGQNPSGVTMSKRRKQRLYKIAERHDLLVLEDDPYYYLRLDDGAGNGDDGERQSLWSIDQGRGRTLRFDSFSKIVSSGMRLGFVTGPSTVVEKMQLHQQATTLHASGVSQIVLLALLEHWGHEGLQAHIDRVCALYRAQRDACVAAARKRLGGLCEFDVPNAGMFLWLRSLVADTDALIKVKAADARVILIGGQSFMPDDSPSPYLRASYSTATPENMNIAFERLATLLRDEAKAK